MEEKQISNRVNVARMNEVEFTDETENINVFIFHTIHRIDYLYRTEDELIKT